MSKRMINVMMTVVLCAAMAAQGDTFGTGANQFEIDFVTISGATNPSTGVPAGDGFTFTGVNNDYRMGVYEITNDQWDKFKAELGVPVTGDPYTAYNDDPGPGTNKPTNEVSWYEAAQFVNWLNTSTGHHAAYKFTGTQGQSDYALDTWDAGEADNGTNLYRHKDAFYYLPTENEWVKAAYWNGTALQTWATTDDSTPVALVDSNYDLDFGRWDVGSGSEELNGTFDMMGNVFEWMESPYWAGDYGTGSSRGLRGGSWRLWGSSSVSSAWRWADGPSGAFDDMGFRVATPEPATMGLLGVGGLALLKRRKSKTRRGGS